MVKSLDTTKMQALTADRGEVWKFNPRCATHFNGLHEILIKASKKTMFQVIRKEDLTDEKLMTAIVGAERLINSRPITYQEFKKEMGLIKKSVTLK